MHITFIGVYEGFYEACGYLYDYKGFSEAYGYSHVAYEGFSEAYGYSCDTYYTYIMCVHVAYLYSICIFYMYFAYSKEYE